MSERPLTCKQQEAINQVATTMAIEDMPLTEQCYKNLNDMATGKKSKDEVIADIKRRYSHGR